MISTYMFIAVFALLIVGVITAYFVSDLGSTPVHEPRKAYTIFRPAKLFCVGGPADGRELDVHPHQAIVQVPVPDNDPVDFYDPDTPLEERTIEIVTYRRGLICVPSHGVTYHFLYVEGSKELEAGVEFLRRKFPERRQAQ